MQHVFFVAIKTNYESKEKLISAFIKPVWYDWCVILNKSNSYDELPPSKQFISEDKMAASMSNLRITGDNKMSTLEKRWKMATKDANRHFAEIESRYYLAIVVISDWSHSQGILNINTV